MTFEELLTNNNINKIEIPRIQRDYAQGRKDEKSKRIRENFVSALYIAIKNGQNLNLDFIYGNIDANGTLILLDGQQRLTTLFLLHWYIAKKTNHDTELLKKFSYKIRHSTRDFCAKLIDEPLIFPITQKTISEEIKDQSWFPLSWNKDPSVASMLTMLGEIHKKFNETTITWEDLSKITFYFLPLEDMGLTDDLYIKMNSRGKTLTDFEHLKAELDKQLSILEEKKFIEKNDIRNKFDKEWIDLLFEQAQLAIQNDEDKIKEKKLKNVNTTINTYFLNYIHFICDVIFYKDKQTPPARWNEFDVLKDLFTYQENIDNEKVKENFKTMEKYFDCWNSKRNLSKIKENIKSGSDNVVTPDDFLSSIINKTKNYAKNQIVTQIGNNIFQNSLKKYSPNNLQEFIFLYAVTYYLQHIDKIEFTTFVRRIRIINNLLQNSAAEIKLERMNNILEHVEEILNTGEVEEKDNTFNKYQLQEEKQKIALLKLHPEYADELFELEDHKLLYGQISILFDFEHIENITKNCIETATKFISLFECDFDKIDCALMTIGDYSQKISIEDWRSTQQFGAANQESWKELFHQHDIYTYNNRPDKSKEDFASTRNILLKFLEDNKEINNDILDTKKNDFIKKCEAKKQYPFEYYYLKYNVFRPAKNGMSGKCFKYDTYSYTILRLKDSHSDNYNPYLKEACHKLNNEGKDNYKEDLFNKHKYFKLGQRGLRFKTHSMEHWYLDNQDLFRIYDKNHNILMSIIINQNKDRIDTENRVDKLCNYIKLILDYEEKEQDISLKQYIKNNYQE